MIVLETGANVGYEEFDKILMAEISAGRNTMAFFAKEGSPARAVAESYGRQELWRGRTLVVRIIERRLQALRQEGRIKWSGRAWAVID